KVGRRYLLPVFGVPHSLLGQPAVPYAERSDSVPPVYAMPSLRSVELRVLFCLLAPVLNRQATCRIPAQPRTFLPLPAAVCFQLPVRPPARGAVQLAVCRPSLRSRKFWN